MKKIMLVSVLGLLVTGCGDPPTPPDVALSGTVVEVGQPTTPMDFNMPITAWTGGAGVVNGYIGTSTTAQKLGTLNSDGTFTINLPGKADASLLTTPGVSGFADDTCDKPLSISNEKVKGAGMNLVVDADKDGHITPSTSTMQFNEATSTMDLVIHFGAVIYVDQDASITGTQTCMTDLLGIPVTYKSNVAVNYLKGWNFVKAKMTYHIDGNAGQANGTLDAVNGSLPTDKWVYNDVAMPLSLKPAAQNLVGATLKKFRW